MKYIYFFICIYTKYCGIHKYNNFIYKYMFIYKIRSIFYKSARKKSLLHLFWHSFKIPFNIHGSPKALTGTVIQYYTQGIPCCVLCDGHGTPPPPWILKRCGLEGSWQRLISLYGKTKKISFSCQNIFPFLSFWCL